MFFGYIPTCLLFPDYNLQYSNNEYIFCNSVVEFLVVFRFLKTSAPEPQSMTSKRKMIQVLSIKDRLTFKRIPQQALSRLSGEITGRRSSQHVSRTVEWHYVFVIDLSYVQNAELTATKKTRTPRLLLIVLTQTRRAVRRIDEINGRPVYLKEKPIWWHPIRMSF